MNAEDASPLKSTHPSNRTLDLAMAASFPPLVPGGSQPKNAAELVEGARRESGPHRYVVFQKEA